MPNNLPRQLTSFIGRDREMAEVKRLLTTACLVTLRGTGGAGKTRLALQVGADLLATFPDGVWFVELAPLSDPALVAKAVASALDVPEQPGRPLDQTLIRSLPDNKLGFSTRAQIAAWAVERGLLATSRPQTKGKIRLRRKIHVTRVGRTSQTRFEHREGRNKMPTINADGCPIHVEVQGDEGAPVLMLSNSLGTTHRMWDDQVKPFTEAFRLVRYDRRGHGQSGCPRGPYTMERLGRDVLAVLDALGIERINWCGLSIGGMVGMWLGATAPERINKLILSNTAAYYPDKTVWDDRIKTVRERGLAAVASATMERWFTIGFRERSPQAVQRINEMFLSTPPEGYIACGEAIRDMDHREIIRSITAPTLVIAGRRDPGTTVEAAEFIRSRIPGAALALLDAAHISNVEQPRAYADTVLGFLLKK